MASTRHTEIVTAWLASNDSRDKLIKGAGCFLKLLGIVSNQKKYLKVSAAMSDCRCLMRLLSWVNNTKKIGDALEKGVGGLREVIFLLRVLFDGIFSILDNVVYVGNFFNDADPNLIQLRVISRGSLFWGYVAAVMLDVYDLVKDKVMPNRTQRYFVLVRNACDMVSSVGNVFDIDIGAANAAFLGLLSAIIATNEQIQVAQKSLSPKLGSGKFSNHRQ